MFCLHHNLKDKSDPNRSKSYDHFMHYVFSPRIIQSQYSYSSLYEQLLCEILYNEVYTFIPVNSLYKHNFVYMRLPLIKVLLGTRARAHFSYPHEHHCDFPAGTEHLLS